MREINQNDKKYKAVFKVLNILKTQSQDLDKFLGSLLNRGTEHPFSDAMKRAFAEGRFTFPQTRGVHAEMDVIDHQIRTREPLGYIGISKLCCLGCIVNLIEV